MRVCVGAGCSCRGFVEGSVSYESMDALQLRDRREELHVSVCKLAREVRRARLAGDWAWESGVGAHLDAALKQVETIDRLLKLGVAA